MPMLNQLRLDHANMARLLHVLHLKHRKLAAGDRPNFRLMREVVDYILDYMEGFAVPLERVCSEQLLARVPQAKELSDRLAEEYHALNQRLKRLSDNLDMILMDAVVPIDRFTDDLKAYLDAHRSYLRHEREELFPLIREHFDEDDMKRLAEAMPAGAATKLEQLQDDYPELYAQLQDAPDPLA